MMRLLAMLTILCTAGTAAADAQSLAEAAARELEGWDVPRARAALEALEREAGDGPVVRMLAGRIAFDEGRYDEAAATFAGLETEDGRAWAQLAAEIGAKVSRYERAESAHFVFFYPPGKDEILAPYALQALEEAHERIGAILGYRLPAGEKVRVEIVQDGKELALFSTLSQEAIETTGTIAICKFNKLVITSPKALLRGYEWQDTLAHELIHLFVARKSRNKTPIWLHEGIAKYLETAWRGPPGLALERPAQALLRDAVKKNELITFEAMSPSMALLPSAEAAALAFAEVFAAIEYLQRRDPRNVEKILVGLASGRSDHEAVAAVHGGTFAGFEAAWRAHLKQRDYPKETASLETTRRQYLGAKGRKTDEREGKDATERGAFAEVHDKEARRAAHLGELLRARGQLAAAAAKYGQAFGRVGAEYPDLTTKYARTLLELKRPHEARPLLEAALPLWPTHASTQQLLGRALLDEGRPADAAPHLIAALGVDPFDPVTHEALARVGKATGDDGLTRRAARALALLTGREELGSAADTMAEGTNAAGSAAGATEAVGKLHVTSDRAAEVAVDGTTTGLSTPIMGLRLAPGTRVITLVPLDGGPSRDYEVEIRVGETTKLEGRIPAAR